MKKVLTLNDLPAPLPGKVGWPWTEQSKPVQMPDSSEWPQISIVTPSYNQGQFIEETIRSILLQGYPNLEYIIIDGGSTDESVSIIEQYDPWLTNWMSEPDHGQSHAINKGFERCSGEIMNWLCSDDILLPNALQAIAKRFLERPDVDIVAGYCRYIQIQNNNNMHIQAPSLKSLELIECHNPVAQPACFYRKHLLNRYPAVNESLHFTMDTELWCYFKQQGANWLILEEFLAEAKEDGDNKSNNRGIQSLRESEWIYKNYVQEPISLMFWYKWLRHPVLMVRYRSSKLVRLLTWPIHVGIISVLGCFYGFGRVRAMGWPYIKVWPY